MNRFGLERTYLVPLLVGMLMLANGSSAFAQLLVGSITGTIVDNTGGAVPGATVTVTEASTGVNRTAFTNAEGRFRLDGLPAGSYSVKIQMDGFSQVDLTLPAPLSAREIRDLGKLTMQVGQRSETVTVTASVTPVQTAESSRMATITADDLKYIQTKGRDLFGLIQILPGVQDTNLNRDYSTRTSAVAVTINGANGFNKDIRLDGMNIVDEGGCGSVSVNLNMDAVGEVRVISNGYTAENGRNVGGMISLVTKSGTNRFMGSVMYNARRDRFNENDFFRKVNNQAKPFYEINILGYSFGGPVIIPRFLDSRTARRKMYFFISQEFTDDHQPSTTTRANLPTDAERNGDFSQTFITTGTGAAATYSVGPITDPLTGQQFPGNKIPAAGTPGCGVQFSCINPLGQAMLNLQARPNGILNLEPGQLYTSNSAYDETPEHTRSNTVLRLDSVMSDRTRLSFRFVKDRDDTWEYSAFAPGIGHRALRSPGVVASAAVTQTLGPALVNEMTFGYVHHRFGFEAGPENSTKIGEFDYRSMYASNLLPGFTIPRLQPFAEYGDPPVLPKFGGSQTDQWPYAPRYTASAMSRSNLGSWISNDSEFPMPRMNLSARASFDDTLTVVRGRHTFKFGVSTEIDHKTEPGSPNYLGNFSFSDDANNPLRTRNGYASMLIGAFTTYTELTARVDKAVRHWQADAFAQDSWRMNSRFTLDYGVRLTHAGAQYEVNNNHTGFYPDLWDRAKASRVYRLVCTTPNYVNTATCSSGNQRAVDPLFPNVLLTSTLSGNLVPGTGSQINGISTDGIPGKKPGTYVSFPGLVAAPRVGFAWDVMGDGKTALRASTGVFYNFAASSSAQGFSYSYAGGCPVSCSRVIRYGTFEALANASSQGTNFIETPGSTNIGGFEVPVGHSVNANIALQRDLGFSIVAEIAWVANHVWSPGRTVDDNRLPLYVYSNINNLFNGAAVPANNLRTIYGQYPGMASVTRFVPDLYNKILEYNAMQLSVNRRFSHGLQMGVAYTLAKGMGYSGYDPNIEQVGGAELIRDYYWAPTAEDRRHNVVVNASYFVPAPSWKLVKPLLSDWQVSTVWKMLSGQGVTPTCTSNGSGINNTLPSLTDGLTAACQLTGEPVNLNLSQNKDDYATQHFNVAAFAFPAPTDIDPVTGVARIGAFGSPGTVRMLRHPTWHQWDLTIARRFGFTAFGRPNAGLRIQWQIYNVLDEVQFTNLNAAMQWTGASNNTVLNSTNTGRYTNAGANSGVTPPRIMGLTVRFDW